MAINGCGRDGDAEDERDKHLLEYHRTMVEAHTSLADEHEARIRELTAQREVGPDRSNA